MGLYRKNTRNLKEVRVYVRGGNGLTSDGGYNPNTSGGKYGSRCSCVRAELAGY